MRVKTAPFSLSIVRSIRYIRVNRQSIVNYLWVNRQGIIDLSLRGIAYLTFGMAVSLVWTGGGSVIEFIYTYVLPVYRNISSV
jgi:hypothetical protein